MGADANGEGVAAFLSCSRDCVEDRRRVPDAGLTPAETWIAGPRGSLDFYSVSFLVSDTRKRRLRLNQHSGQIVTGVPSYFVKLNPGNTSSYSVAVSRKIEIAIASPSLIPSTPSDR